MVKLSDKVRTGDSLEGAQNSRITSRCSGAKKKKGLKVSTGQGNQEREILPEQAKTEAGCDLTKMVTEGLARKRRETKMRTRWNSMGSH